MKIGILTLPLDENYGGILQAYALQTILEKGGHEVSVFVKKYPKKPSMVKKYVGSIVQVIRYLMGWRKVRICWWKTQVEIKLMRQYTDRFIDAHINSNLVDSLKDIELSNYDAIVVGSDQVWRKIYFEESWHTSIKNAFLKFAENCNLLRISYAASFGLDNINEYSVQDVKEIKGLLQNFDFVSVRESSGVEICRELGVLSEHVLDPTLLLGKMDYDELLKMYDYTKKGELFNYILDSNQSTDMAIEMICQKKNWSTFRVNKNKLINVEGNIQMPLEEWLSSFKYSRAVVTDSFHACVFSLIYNKPFLVMINPSRGISRVESLLQMFKQETRLVSSNVQLEEKYHLLEIEPNVENLIVEGRNKSIEKLYNSLKK